MEFSSQVDNRRRMDLDKLIAIIAPDPMAGALSVLTQSAPNRRLLASAKNLDELRIVLGEKEPDVLLVYLVQESESCGGKAAFEIIARTKIAWPDVVCIAIVKYASQLDKAKQIGADLAFVDGVDARRLLTALEG